MELLGKLGIDVRLLIAQIVNFTLLVVILAKYLYKPIIKKIEKDEAELSKAQIETERLANDRKDFEENRSKIRIEVKKQSNKIIKDAEGIAKEIRNKAREQTKVELAQIIDQRKKQIESQRIELEEDCIVKAKKEVIDNLQSDLQNNISNLVKQNLQDYFFSLLIKELNNFSTKEISSQKSIILEHALPLSSSQQKELDKIFLKKIRNKTTIKNKPNKKLISGFRLEIAGIIIESNLLNQINNAAETK